MTTVTIGAGGDITGNGPNYSVLKESTPTTNIQTGGAVAASYASGDRSHTLFSTPGFANVLAFLGLSAPVVVNSASLAMRNFDNGGSGTTRNFDLHRVIVNTTETQATWNVRQTATNWTTAGALGSSDVNLTALASVSAWALNATNSFSGASVASYVQGILNGTITNQGVLMVRNSDTAYDTQYEIFDSFIWTLDVVAGAAPPTSYYLSDTFEM